MFTAFSTPLYFLMTGFPFIYYTTIRFASFCLYQLPRIHTPHVRFFSSQSFSGSFLFLWPSLFPAVKKEKKREQEEPKQKKRKKKRSNSATVYIYNLKVSSSSSSNSSLKQRALCTLFSLVPCIFKKRNPTMHCSLKMIISRYLKCLTVGNVLRILFYIYAAISKADGPNCFCLPHHFLALRVQHTGLALALLIYG